MSSSREYEMTRILLSCFCLIMIAPPGSASEPPKDIYAQENLVAWCIVPFDAKKRTPAERVAMLQKLGFKRYAYDWRAEHLPSFDEEIGLLQKAGIEGGHRAAPTPVHVMVGRAGGCAPIGVAQLPSKAAETTTTQTHDCRRLATVLLMKCRKTSQNKRLIRLLPSGCQREFANRTAVHDAAKLE